MRVSVAVPLLLLSASLVISRDFTETFSIRPYEKTTRSVELNEGDFFKGYVRVVAGFKDFNLDMFLPDIFYYVRDPDGNALNLTDEFGFIIAPDTPQYFGHSPFNFTASKAGTYTVHFDNQFNVTRRIEFDYGVTETVAGIPKEFWSLIVPVALVVSLAVGLVVILNPKRRKQTVPTPTPTTTTPPPT